MEAREYVEEMFKAMPVEQLVKVFNEYVTDSHAFRFPCIYEMDDEENWNRMNQFADRIKALAESVRESKPEAAGYLDEAHQSIGGAYIALNNYLNELLNS